MILFTLTTSAFLETCSYKVKYHSLPANWILSETRLFQRSRASGAFQL